MESYDLLIVGGGINGAGIARDAAGRGMKVLLVERDDLASHTSSASTKLIHGGLRYLEYYEFRLVREALEERKRLLQLVPQIIRPLRFVMPMPPTGRPRWLIRMGLFLYDHIGGRSSLPGSCGVTRGNGVFDGLKAEITRGFAYSDAWVDDARLVVLNALGARDKDADIRTRTALVSARREGDLWRATLSDDSEVAARALVNAAGPWVGEVLRDAGARGGHTPRLVKGSHIIVPRRLPGEHAFLFQNPDKRIVFAIPYEREFTLIGTTDVPFEGDASAPVISAEETEYLCESVNRYLAEPITAADVVHSYSGVRPLYDDGHENAASVTRDYVLEVDDAGPPLLSVFGGKITTYRRLAEHALEKLAPFLPVGAAWTAREPLPRVDIPSGSRDLGGITTDAVDYFVANEWARTAEDILWRRTKVGLHTGAETAEKLRAYLGERR